MMQNTKCLHTNGLEITSKYKPYCLIFDEFV